MAIKFPLTTEENQRRAELIHKKNRGGLTHEEWTEYNSIQERFAAWIQAYNQETRGEFLTNLEMQLQVLENNASNQNPSD